VRITIIREDNIIILDGRPITIDLSDMSSDIHAIQWYDDTGHIEYPGNPNQTIQSVAPFQVWIDRGIEASSLEDNAIPIPPGIPTVVTMRQARLALLQFPYEDTNMLEVINSTIANMPGGDGDTALIEWEFAGTVERNSSIVQSMSVSLGLTEEQLDTLFTLAASL
jgi:hypothetical protein